MSQTLQQKFVALEAEMGRSDRQGDEMICPAKYKATRVRSVTLAGG